MARKKSRKRSSGGRKRATSRKRSASVRASRNTAPKRANPSRKRGGRKRSTVARSRKRYTSRKRNSPFSLGGGSIGEASKLVIASIGIGWVNRNFTQPLVSRFVPGQLAVPASTIATGYGLGILAGFTSLTAPLKKPFQLMGWVLGLTALVTPYLAGVLGGGQQQQMKGMRGIGVFAPPPGRAKWIQAAPPQQAMRGVGVFQSAGVR